MAERKDIFFVSDVHLGLKVGDPLEREARFVSFLKGIPRDTTKAVYLLGDIWDFWYEYRDVVPREGARVVAALLGLMDDGVEVWFCPGNHDIWHYGFLESLGMHRFDQPFHVRLGDKDFCLGHGDALGGAKWSYRLIFKLFRCRFLQRLFSMLHPWLAYRFGLAWSDSNRRTHAPYVFKGESEPLYRFGVEICAEHHVDYFVFGHFHCAAEAGLPGGSSLFVLKDWLDGDMPHGYFNGSSFELRSQAPRA